MLLQGHGNVEEWKKNERKEEEKTMYSLTLPPTSSKGLPVIGLAVGDRLC